MNHRAQVQEGSSIYRLSRNWPVWLRTLKGYYVAAERWYGRKLRRTILHPEYIGARELHRAMKIASHWVHGVLLDAGCGAKPYYSLLRPKLERYIGLDYPPYLESGAQPTQTEVFGDVCRLPFPDSYFDCALCTQVLEHVSEPGMAIAELHRVLAPGGVLILTAPRSEAVHGAPYDFFRYTKYGLWNLLQKDGKFEVERTEYLGFFWADVSRQWDVYAFEHLGGPTLVGFVLRRILLFPALWISIVLVNIVGGIILDRIDKIEASSPNYLVVARKK